MKENVLQKMCPALGTVNTVAITGEYDSVILVRAQLTLSV